MNTWYLINKSWIQYLVRKVIISDECKVTNILSVFYLEEGFPDLLDESSENNGRPSRYLITILCHQWEQISTLIVHVALFVYLNCNFLSAGTTDYANYYQGLWDCSADEPDELAFQRGDLIYVISKVSISLSRNNPTRLFELLLEFCSFWSLS